MPGCRRTRRTSHVRLITIGCGIPAVIGWDGFTVHTSSVSPELRQASEQVVPISRRKIFEKWAGVQCEQAHPAQDALVYAIDHRVVNVLMRRMAPPA